MNGIPAWLPAAHLAAAVLTWGLCLYVTFAYSWQVGLILLCAIEFRVVTAVYVRMKRLLGGAV
jgi:hypothetical protein